MQAPLIGVPIASPEDVAIETQASMLGASEPDEPAQTFELRLSSAAEAGCCGTEGGPVIRVANCSKSTSVTVTVLNIFVEGLPNKPQVWTPQSISIKSLNGPAAAGDRITLPPGEAGYYEVVASPATQSGTWTIRVKDYEGGCVAAVSGTTPTGPALCGQTEAEAMLRVVPETAPPHGRPSISCGFPAFLSCRACCTHPITGVPLDACGAATMCCCIFPLAALLYCVSCGRCKISDF